MQQLANYLERFGNTFLVASLVPSLAFVSTLLFIFDPIFPASVRNRFYGTQNPLLQSGLGIVLVTIILGFTLTSLNTFIFKVFEGYVLLNRFPFLTRKQVRKARALKSQIESVSKLIAKLEKINSPSIEKRLIKLRDLKHNLLVTYDETFPLSESEVLPTSFGNIFKAAETYSLSRYGIDGVPIWPRLIQVIPDRYMAFIDKDANQLSFLMNCAILSFLVGLLSIIAGGYQFFLSYYVKVGNSFFYFNPVNLSPEIYRERSFLYWIGSISAIVVSLVFVRASLLILKDYGNLIRSAYDLFRKDLLIQLNYGLPSSTTYEYDHWGAICEFMTLGNPNDDLVLDYHYWNVENKTD